MPVDASVAAAIAARGVTRVVHLTPARNVPGIMADGALRSVADMSGDARAVYAPNDLLRLDGHPDKVSCSIEYANAFYLRKARGNATSVNFPYWVCFFLRPEVAATPGTLFCPRNAGAFSASKIAGAAGLEGLYAPRVVGSGGNTYERTTRHNPRCPTDVQAELLIPAPIPLSAAYAIVFPSPEAAATEAARLEQIAVHVPGDLQWLVVPDMFRTTAVTNAVRYAQPMGEVLWHGTGPRV